MLTAHTYINACVKISAGLNRGQLREYFLIGYQIFRTQIRTWNPLYIRTSIRSQPLWIFLFFINLLLFLYQHIFFDFKPAHELTPISPRGEYIHASSASTRVRVKCTLESRRVYLVVIFFNIYFIFTTFPYVLPRVCAHRRTLGRVFYERIRACCFFICTFFMLKIMWWRCMHDELVKRCKIPLTANETRRIILIEIVVQCEYAGSLECDTIDRSNVIRERTSIVRIHSFVGLGRIYLFIELFFPIRILQ